MEAWVLVLAIGATQLHQIEIQNEDACINVAKQLTKYMGNSAACINQFDGRVYWFNLGKQVDR